MNHKTRAPKHHISRAAATLAATMLLAAPLGASAQTSATPTQDQMNTIQSLTSQVFDDVHYAKADDFAQITTPDFIATYPDGTTLGAPDVIGRATTRTVGEVNYQRNVTIDSMTTDGSTIIENVTVNAISSGPAGVNELGSQNVMASSRTLTWVQGADGNWLLASERINDSEVSQV